MAQQKGRTSKADATRRQLLDAAIEVISERGYADTTVERIVEVAGVSKGVAYYHFSSKLETALWVFRCALDEKLRAALPPDQLVAQPFSKRIPQDLALYSHVEIGARTLDASKFTRALLECVATDTEFYRKLFTVMEPELLSAMEQLYYPLLEADVKFILDGRYMPPETLQMVTTLSVRQIVNSVEFFLAHPRIQDELLDPRMNPFGNALQESLFEMIQAHPINRYVRR